MHRTKVLITEALDRAKQLDLSLIAGRASSVGRNLSLIEGKTRSEKYPHRLAGKSSDIERFSRTQDSVIWFGASAAEDPFFATQFEQFWKPLFDYAKNLPRFYALRDFWTVEEEINNLLSQMRLARLSGDAHETRRNVVRIEQALKEISQILDTEIVPVPVKRLAARN